MLQLRILNTSHTIVIIVGIDEIRVGLVKLAPIHRFFRFPSIFLLFSQFCGVLVLSCCPYRCLVQFKIEPVELANPVFKTLIDRLDKVLLVAIAGSCYFLNGFVLTISPFTSLYTFD